MEKLVIIDGNSLINRAFYALPLLSNKDGEYSNAVYGFTNMLLKVILEANPSHIVVAFDYGKKTFRNDLYKEYKGTRKGTPEELKPQFAILKRMLEAMGITYIEISGVEADDIIGSISKEFLVPTIILTGDKDSLQLIDDTTEVWLTKKGISEVAVMNDQTFFEQYGLKPIQMIDLKSLMGDSSDNIPGVKGVGEKTAVDLLKTYTTTENLYEHIDEIKGKLKEKLIESKDMAFLSKTLATIKTDVKIDYSLDDFTYDFPFNRDVFDIFMQYNFNSLIKRNEIYKSGENKIVSQKEYKKCEITSIDDLKEKVNLAKATRIFAFDIDSPVSFSVDGKTEYKVCIEQDLLGGGIALENVLSIFAEVMTDSGIIKICNDRKKILKNYDNFFSINGEVFDTLLAYYLVSGGDKVNVAEMLLNYKCDPEFIACSMFDLKETFEKALKEYDLEYLYYDVELPLEMTLYDMEKTGFMINREVLLSLQENYSNQAKELENMIYDLAGQKFNLQSPKQTAKVLFEDLQLKTTSKKLSTSAEILEEISSQHPIVPLILRFRQIQKLVSTYLTPFDELTKSENIIHTEFKQMLTSTGRLSSIEPNLQNIPTRTEEGKALRKMFVPINEDGYIVSADYSQIELRLLAHFSEDKNLLFAYNNGQDIHMQTASEVFGVPFQEVTPAMRRDAKVVNFGIVYGMSDYGLSQSLGCPVYQAKEYITTYFNKFPGVKAYTDRSIEFAKENGYVKTLLNRRRKILEISSSNYLTRKFGERASMNMPLQGTASDIIKLAMVRVDQEIKKRNLKSKLILQIHDELIVDTAKDELNIRVNLLKDTMENVVKLNVPLEVDVNMGKDWFDCK